MKVKCTQRYGYEWTGMCRHMQRVSLTDRRLTPSRIVRNDVAQWEHVFIPLWSPYITHLGKWIGLTLYMWQFHPAFNTQVTEGKKIQQRFYILIWSVNCSWDMEDEIIFIKLAGLFETWTDSFWCLSPFNLLKSAYLRDYIRFFACFCQLSI